MSSEFYQFIKEHAQNTPNAPAIIDVTETLTYAQLLEQIEKFAGALEGIGVHSKSKMGILCLNQKEYIIAYLAALLKRMPVIPLNFMLKPEDLVFIAKDSGIDTLVLAGHFVKPESAPVFQMFPRKIYVGPLEHIELLGQGAVEFKLFVDSGDPEKGKQAMERPAGIPDVILYTSGTTARPKGVMLEEAQFKINTDGVLEHLPFKPEDRVIMALPLFHSFGNIIALIILRTGGTLILIPQFAPKSILGAIDKHKASILPLVPTIYSFLVDLYSRGGYDVSSLKYCISGGAALPRALLEKVETVLDVTVIEGYGLTETAPVIAVNTYRDGSVPGSVGPVLPNLEAKILNESGEPLSQGEVGEICVRGPSVMKGYWNRDDETREILSSDGWLKTGDLGHLDENNLLYISAGRKKDLIIRAGENVSPLAIENALMNHPGVAEVAAVGIPHERMGEQVKVCVVFRPGANEDISELKTYCREKLPAFMAPDIIEKHDALPKNATGKILKNQLREEGSE